MNILELAKPIADSLAKLKEQFLPTLGKNEELIKNLGKKVKEEIVPMASEFFKNLFGTDNIFVEKTDILTIEKIVEISKKYLVEGSDEVAAYKQLKDDTFFVYLAYCKDGDLIAEEANKYIIIEADGLAKDVKELFVESDIVVLR